ncbi:hypothetical protein C8Q75DRAFT_810714 [Abortiporus biennis]|nr:hypothetical protein C8Q75DRAFT_810714 [Abortiporus biennis]
MHLQLYLLKKKTQQDSPNQSSHLLLPTEILLAIFAALPRPFELFGHLRGIEYDETVVHPLLDRQTTLFNLVLVCKYWNTILTPALYSYPTLPNIKHAYRLRHTLKSKPTLIPLLKRIHVTSIAIHSRDLYLFEEFLPSKSTIARVWNEVVHKQVYHPASHNIIKLLTLCTNVESLTIHYPYFRYLDAQRHHILFPILMQSPELSGKWKFSLKRLFINAFEFKGQEFTNIGTFVNLQILSLRGCRFERYRSITFPALPSLHTLQFIDCEFYKNIQGPFLLPSIHTLQSFHTQYHTATPWIAMLSLPTLKTIHSIGMADNFLPVFLAGYMPDILNVTDLTLGDADVTFVFPFRIERYTIPKDLQRLTLFFKEPTSSVLNRMNQFIKHNDIQKSPVRIRKITINIARMPPKHLWLDEWEDVVRTTSALGIEVELHQLDVFSWMAMQINDLSEWGTLRSI